MAHTILDFIEDTNFNDLRDQKTALITVIELLNKTNDNTQTDLAEKLEGLLSFIDSFQDMAVDTYGQDENQVFNLSSDEDEEWPTELRSKIDIDNTVE